MAKRFIDTELFNDEWFMDLSKEAKLLYIYLFTNCDHAGIIKLNSRLTKFQIGIKDLVNTLGQLGNRIIKFDKELDNVYFLPKFIKFQYPDFPKSNVRQQESALKILEKYGIDFNSYLSVLDSYEHVSVSDNDNVTVINKKGVIKILGDREIIIKDYFLNLLPIDSEQGFIEAWVEWVDYRKEIKKKLTKTSAKKQINYLLKQPSPTVCIEQSIRNQWQGLFEKKEGNNGRLPKGAITNDIIEEYKKYTPIKT